MGVSWALDWLFPVTATQNKKNPEIILKGF
jgi:hypothetical protein